MSDRGLQGAVLIHNEQSHNRGESFASGDAYARGSKITDAGRRRTLIAVTDPMEKRVPKERRVFGLKTEKKDQGEARGSPQKGTPGAVGLITQGEALQEHAQFISAGNAFPETCAAAHRGLAVQWASHGHRSKGAKEETFIVGRGLIPAGQTGADCI